MNPSNLPPGCSASDIPGNRPEDEAWENLLNEIIASGLCVEFARARWDSQPKLLKAAKMALKIVPGDQVFDDERRALRAAIKKAKVV